ncbi:aspartate ammonia-lyase [Thermorudis peleae]|uniref:aspartate ammonia-lyase n=1 Tax=Thermorudis peleae TaxID=1382356 RepID=UPI00056FAC88|nr:aspartate ammonia-lyase [Thermorudis peleae]
MQVADMRVERDSLGEVHVPADVLYGAQTARAVANFPISGQRPHRDYIVAIAQVKLAAARVNHRAGRLNDDVARAIEQAAQEIIDGQWHEHFVVDPYQAGAGTSHNMNANEVIANRANEILGGRRGEYKPVHPNDHVNLGQSSNDVIPTAARLALLRATPRLLEALRQLSEAFCQKAQQFVGYTKTGRTHLQDAVPIRLGDEFSGYAAALRRAADRIASAREALYELNLGATALGTGINAFPGYRKAVAAELSAITGWPLRPAYNTFEITQSHADFALLSAALRNAALEVIRIANDIRLLSSGPRAGLGEIILPPVQPGSSIMPGKVNPSIAEMVNMVAFQVVGYDHAVALAVQAGQLDLNVWTPLIIANLLWAIDIFTNALQTFRTRCIEGITANEARLAELAHGSIALATILTPKIGYLRAAEIAKKAWETGKTVRDVVVEEGVLSPEEADVILDPAKMALPQDPDANQCS